MSLMIWNKLPTKKLLFGLVRLDLQLNLISNLLKAQFSMNKTNWQMHVTSY